MALQASQRETVADFLSRGELFSAAESLREMVRLAAEVHQLHTNGSLHGAIQTENVLVDPVLRHLSLSDNPTDFVSLAKANGSFVGYLPEFDQAKLKQLPVELTAAREVLKGADLQVDPIRIDVCQLVGLFCRLLTGSSTEAYLRSPRCKFKVATWLQPLLERAIGCGDLDGFHNVDQFVKAMREVQASAPCVEVDTTNLAGDKEAQLEAERPTASMTDDRASSQLADENRVDKLGHYEIVKLIGKGGMGNVFKADEPALDRTVAIKVLADQFQTRADFVSRFRAEATAAAKLIHPNIAQIFFIGEQDGKHFFVMQYVDGESLSELLTRCGRLDVAETLAIIEQALSGLSVAHKQGFVHRDIKPGNILIDRKNGRVLLADFGLVKSTDQIQSTTETGVVIGTVDYIAPEQAQSGDVDGRADLYSIGVVLYRMLSGQLPFQSDNPSSVIFQHVYERPKPLDELKDGIPAALSAIVERLLAKSPDDRPASADELLVALRQFRTEQLGTDFSIELSDIGLRELLAEDSASSAITLTGHSPTPAQQDSLAETLTHPRRRKAMRWAFGVSALAIGLLFVLFMYLGRGPRVPLPNGPPAHMHTFHGGWEEVTVVRFTPDGQQLVAGGGPKLMVDDKTNLPRAGDAAIRIWDIKSSLQSHVLDDNVVRPDQIAISDDGRFVVSISGSKGRLSAWELASGRLIGEQTDLPYTYHTDIAFFPNKSQFVAVGAEVVAAGVTQLATRPRVILNRDKISPEIQRGSRVTAVAVFSDGRLLTAADDSIIRIWDIEQRLELGRLIGHTGQINALAISSDGRIAVSRAIDRRLNKIMTSDGIKTSDVRVGTIRVWDVATRKPLYVFADLDSGNSTLAITPNGRFVVAAGERVSSPNGQQPLVVWDLSNGRERHRYPSGTIKIKSVAISPDGRFAASGDSEGNIQLWRLPR